MKANQEDCSEAAGKSEATEVKTPCYRCSPSTNTTDAEDSGVGAVMNASDAALHSSKTSRAGSCDDVESASLSSQSQFQSSVAQRSGKPRNPPLQWSTDELRLVSQMRQGMMNTSRRKRSKKPKDAPKRPLRWVRGSIITPAAYLSTFSRVSIFIFLSSLKICFPLPCSAYNIFFQEERARLLSQEGMLSDSSGKKLGFENLAKIVGAKWKAMTSDEQRAAYKDKAAVSLSHYLVIKVSFCFYV